MATKREILVVEDNPGDAYLICDVLKKGSQPCHVSVAVDGVKAVNFLKEHDCDGMAPDIVLLDLNLPVKDGRAVLSEVKADAALRRIPIVVFSTSQASSDIEHCYELGANCYVRKPGNLVDFISAVEALSRFWFGPASLPAKIESAPLRVPSDSHENALRSLLEDASGVPPRICQFSAQPGRHER